MVCLFWKIVLDSLCNFNQKICGGKFIFSFKKMHHGILSVSAGYNDEENYY
jgi:hypothetical protein